MPLFEIFKHPTGDTASTYGYNEAVRQGFNWWGMLFGGFWAAMVGYRPLMILMFILYWFMDYIFSIITAIVTIQSTKIILIYFILKTLTIIVMHILIGFKGNAWRKSYYLKNKYQYLGTIEADSLKAALLSIGK